MMNCCRTASKSSLTWSNSGHLSRRSPSSIACQSKSRVHRTPSFPSYNFTRSSSKTKKIGLFISKQRPAAVACNTRVAPQEELQSRIQRIQLRQVQQYGATATGQQHSRHKENRFTTLLTTTVQRTPRTLTNKKRRKKSK